MIRAERLTKQFGATVAVDDLSFEVKPGMVTGFLGPNGSGKSTTMRMILGLDNPTSGLATVGGRSYRENPAPIHEVGAVLDPKAVYGKRSAVRHLTWVAQAGGIPTRRVEEVLDLVGLTQVADKQVGGFSLGMSQRLGIATALLGDPEVLLFDEPVNGLDPEGILWIRTLMRNLAKEGRTVFVSSHLMSEMERTADHVIVIGKGKMVADTSMAEFMRLAAGDAVRVVSPQAATFVPLLEAGGAEVHAEEDPGALLISGIDAARVGELAAEHRIVLHELTTRNVSLEQAFMDLTRDSVEYQSHPAA
ncbi:MAG: ATP-binding cassette domain-containing protein [Thermomicrobiales bacterium]|nr:ATP-binding cassette domain-containing protein [Thermomicrobiales bacterium]MCO5220563.1 ATP-binding cassette domain-containing protein [Thermomicrobiales bacterium]